MVTSTRTYPADAGRGRSRSRARQRWGAVIAGGALTTLGITRRSPFGLALVAAGGTLAVVGATRRSRPGKASTSTTLLVNCSRQEAYQFWRDFENLPRFMNRLENVSLLDNRRSRWTAIGPTGRPITWDSEITAERENEFITWRSLPSSEVQVNGTVEFRQAPADRGTFITARLEFSSLPGMDGAIAKFFNKGANFALRQDLRRLEAIMEAGEIPTTEGQTHGPRDFTTGVLRVADPTRPIPAGANMKDAFIIRRNIA